MADAPTYWDYLGLDRLLTLQGGLEGTEDGMLADELHFIVIHQNFELWFKLLLSEMRLARDHLGTPTVAEETIPYVVSHIRRINTVLRHCVAQFEVMETLTPQGFLDFRDKVAPASGFQSFQMREVEILMGLEDADRIRYGGVDPVRHIEDSAHDTPAGRMAKDRMAAVRKERTVFSVVVEWLTRTPINGSTPDDPNDAQVVTEFLHAYLARMEAHHEVALARLLETLEVQDPTAMRERFATNQDRARAFVMAEDVVPKRAEKVRRARAGALFIESYRELPLLSWPRLLLDLIVDLEEQFVLFRHRHVRMVERIIGRRVGTGGSGGVEYLEKTLSYRIFGDLWAIRAILLPNERLPALKAPEYYGYRTP